MEEYVCLPVPAVWEQMLSKSMVSKSSLNKESLTVYCQWKGYKVAYPAANICSISFFLCLYKNYIKIAKYTLNKLKSLSREATQHDKRTKRCGVPRTLQCWGRDMYLRAQLQIGISLLLSAISGCSCVIAASESAEAVSVPLKDDNRGVNSGMVTIDSN